jgi:hypothetical protein
MGGPFSVFWGCGVEKKCLRLFELLPLEQSHSRLRIKSSFRIRPPSKPGERYFVIQNLGFKKSGLQEPLQKTSKTQGWVL